MYFAKDVIKNIDAALKAAGKTKGGMCQEIGINKNTINSMTDKKGISSFDLAKIADFLEVSVDSLLGRESEQKESTMSSSHGAITGYDEQEKRLLKAFRKLTVIEKENLIGRAEILAEQNDEARKKGVI